MAGLLHCITDETPHYEQNAERGCSDIVSLYGGLPVDRFS